MRYSNGGVYPNQNPYNDLHPRPNSEFNSGHSYNVNCRYDQNHNNNLYSGQELGLEFMARLQHLLQLNLLLNSQHEGPLKQNVALEKWNQRDILLEWIKMSLKGAPEGIYSQIEWVSIMFSIADDSATTKGSEKGKKDDEEQEEGKEYDLDSVKEPVSETKGDFKLLDKDLLAGLKFYSEVYKRLNSKTNLIKQKEKNFNLKRIQQILEILIKKSEPFRIETDPTFLILIITFSCMIQVQPNFDTKRRKTLFNQDSLYVLINPLIKFIYKLLSKVQIHLFKSEVLNSSQSSIYPILFEFLNISVNTFHFKYDTQFSETILTLSRQLVNTQFNQHHQIKVLAFKVDLICNLLKLDSNELSLINRRAIANLSLTLIKSSDQIGLITYHLTNTKHFSLEELNIILLDHLQDSDIHLRKIYSEILLNLSPLKWDSNHEQNKHSQNQPQSDSKLILDRHIRGSPHISGFLPHHFEFTMIHLGLGEFLVSNQEELNEEIFLHSKDDMSWRQQLIFDCCHGKVSQYIQRRLDSAELWLGWEVARYCILSRLRTPFGNGAHQTLKTFENVINFYLKTSEKPALSKLSQFIKIMDCLEIWIKHSLYGHYSFLKENLRAIPEAPASSVLFFNENSAFYTGWLQNTKLLRYQLARLAHHPTAMRLLSWEWLTLVQEDYYIIFNNENKLLITLEMISDIVLSYPPKQQDTVIELWDLRCWIQEFRHCLKDEKIKFKSVIPLLDIMISYINCLNHQSGLTSLEELSNLILNFESSYKYEIEFAERLIQFISHWIESRWMILENVVKGSSLSNRIKIDECHTLLSKLRDKEEQSFSFHLDSAFQYPSLDLSTFDIEESIITSEICLAPKVYTTYFNKFGGLDSWIKHITQSNFKELGFNELNVTLQSIRLWNQLKCGDGFKSCPTSLRKSITKLFNDYVSSNDVLSENSSKMNLFDPSIQLKDDLPFSGLLQTTDDCKIWETLFLLAEHSVKDHLESGFQPLLIESKKVLYLSILKLKQRLPLLDYQAYANKFCQIISGFDGTLIQIESLKGGNPRLISQLMEWGSGGTGKPWNLLNYERRLSFFRWLHQILNKEDHQLEMGNYPLDQIDDLYPDLGSFSGGFYQYPLYPNKIQRINRVAEMYMSSSVYPEDKLSLASYYLDQIEGLKSNLRDRPQLTLAHYFGVDPAILRFFQGIDEFYDTLVAPLFQPERFSALAPYANLQLEMHAHVVHLVQLALSYLLDYVEQVNPKIHAKLISSALRVLKLVYTFGWCFSEAMVDKLMSIGRQKVWGMVIEQLTYGLAHKEERVRSIIGSILVTYLKNHEDGAAIYFLMGKIKDEGAGLGHSDDDMKLRSSLKPILFNMELWSGKDHLKGISWFQSVSKVVLELLNIVSLWDERWYHKLNQLSLDMNRKFKKAYNEFDYIEKKFEGSQNITSFQMQVYHNLFETILKDLEELNESTFRATPNNLYNHQVNKKYGQWVKNALDLMRHPSDLSNISKGWEQLEALQKKLSSEILCQRSLKLTELSQWLGELDSYTFILPLTQHPNILRGVRFAKFVTVIPTKTKPKKLSMWGEDGNKYTFLLKGYEDLQLDRVIMQMMKLSNLVNSKLKCHSYDIIPFGSEGGLVQWVNHTVPLHTLFKSFQSRQNDHHALILASKKPKSKPTILETIECPSEPSSNSLAFKSPNQQYWEQAKRILKQHGITGQSRKQWPNEVHLEIYHALCKTVDKDIFYNELMGYTIDARAFLAKRLCATQSMAAMSIFGYFLGLGDRHLDNILWDLDYGHFVHIDFNISFFRGLDLPMPEVIPFRLTRSLARLIRTPHGGFALYCQDYFKRMQAFPSLELVLDLIPDSLAHRWLAESFKLKGANTERQHINTDLMVWWLRIGFHWNAFRNELDGLEQVRCQLSCFVKEVRASSSPTSIQPDKLSLRDVSTVSGMEITHRSSKLYQRLIGPFQLLTKLLMGLPTHLSEETVIQRYQKVLAGVDQMNQAYATLETCFKAFEQAEETNVPASLLDELLGDVSKFIEEVSCLLNLLTEAFPTFTSKLSGNKSGFNSDSYLPLREPARPWLLQPEKPLSSMRPLFKEVLQRIRCTETEVEKRVYELIDTSMNEDLLSKMFEGWTPWV